MEASFRTYPLLAATAAAIASSSCGIDAFTMPQTQMPSLKQHSSLAAIGLGPESDAPPIEGTEKVAEETPSEKKAAIDLNPYDPDRIVLGEDGLPLPHITDHDPYRTTRMSNSDRAADAWFTALLESPGGDSFLGAISEGHKERLLSKVELGDEPVLVYGEDEEWTPYVSRRLPTSPLYPAYGLETYGLPILRRGAEAWRHFDVNGLLATDYSTVPEGIGSDYELSEGEKEGVITSFKGKGAWLDDAVFSTSCVCQWAVLPGVE